MFRVVWEPVSPSLLFFDLSSLSVPPFLSLHPPVLVLPLLISLFLFFLFSLALQQTGGSYGKHYEVSLNDQSRDLIVTVNLSSWNSTLYSWKDKMDPLLNLRTAQVSCEDRRKNRKREERKEQRSEKKRGKEEQQEERQEREGTEWLSFCYFSQIRQFSQLSKNSPNLQNNLRKKLESTSRSKLIGVRLQVT